MKLKIIQAVRNEHVSSTPIYPVHNIRMDYAVGDFYAKYFYFPNYVYRLQDEAEYVFVVVDKQFAGDGKEDKIEQVYEIFNLSKRRNMV